MIPAFSDSGKMLCTVPSFENFILNSFSTFYCTQQNNVNTQNRPDSPATRPQNIMETCYLSKNVRIIQLKYKTKENHEDQVVFCFENEYKQ